MTTPTKKPYNDPLLVEKRKVRNLTKHLKDLTTVIQRGLSQLDSEMQAPSTPERGSRIAMIGNAIELQNDIAIRFGLNKEKS